MQLDVCHETVAKKALTSGSFADLGPGLTANVFTTLKVGTVERYPDEAAARRSVVGLVSELNADGRPTNSGVLTVAQFCDHFVQRELSKDNTWRSYSTKTIYQAYLSRWTRPH